MSSPFKEECGRFMGLPTLFVVLIEMLPIICWDIIVKYAERDASILRSCHKGMNILVDVLNSKLQAHGLEQKNFKEWSYAFSMWKYEVKRKHTEGRKLLPHENRFIQLCISHGIKVLIAQENDSKTLAQDTGTLPVPKKDEPERKKMKLSPGISDIFLWSLTISNLSNKTVSIVLVLLIEMPQIPLSCWNIMLDYADTDTVFLSGNYQNMHLLTDILNSKCSAFGLENRTTKEWSSAFSRWQNTTKKKYSENRKLLPHEDRLIWLCIRHSIIVKNSSKLDMQKSSTTVKDEEPEVKKPKFFSSTTSVNHAQQQNLKELLKLQKEVIRLNKNCDFITLTENIEELNELMEDEDSSSNKKLFDMSITDEVATFIIDYAEKGTNAILLQMNNNKCHEIWLKLAPLLNIMSERSIKFMEWQRIFSNWCENILVKHQQNHPLKPHEERYIELHAKQITSNRAVPSTSTVSQTTEDNSGILDENFIRFVEKISKLEDNWDFPTTVSVTVSVLTLTIISIDRWYALCFPLKFKSTIRRAKSAIVIIWILALLFDIPELIVYHTEEQNYYRIETFYLTQCTANWSETTNHLWNLWKMLSLYLIPLIIMATSYCNIICVLWKPNRTHHELDIVDNTQLYTFSISSNSNTKGQLKSRKKAAKMLVSVVIMFAICYFPVHLHNVLRIAVRLSNSDGNRIFSFISHWLCYANSAMNPLIYNFMSGKFRKEFKRSYECCCRSSRNRNQRELMCLYNKGSSFKSRTSSKLSKQKSGSDVRRTTTVITKITE
ncbi:7 transmembrane receptor (rhodopsin family) [Popillia japonica]|uniref:7 transmembrane receptor (Rhodopsin family) n=1 Tax=Popillia japonica TaxID=7064 RepID=A0AAW1IAT8_POPJA